MGYLILATVVFITLSHLALWRWMGRKSVTWAHVEYVWCALSFVGLGLAAVQLSERQLSQDLRIEQDAMDYAWHSSRSSANSIYRLLTDEGQINDRNAGPRIPIVSGNSFQDLLIINTLVNRLHDRTSMTRYNNNIVYLCQKELTKGDGTTLLPGMNELKAINFRVDQSTMSWRERDLVANWIMLCQVAEIIQTRYRIAQSLEKSTYGSTIYSLSFLWTYILILGLSLKLAKTTSEFMERRREQMAAVAASQVAAHQTDES